MKKKLRIVVGLIIIGSIAGMVYWWQASRQYSINENTLTLYGNVDIREAHLAFNASEHVAEILVDEGDQVKTGQLLARLHTERLQASLKQAQANLTALQAEAKAATLSYKRIKSLALKKLASTEKAEEAEAKHDAANAHVTAAVAGVTVAEQILKDTNLYAPMAGIIRDRIVEPGDFVTPQTPILTLALANPVWVRAYLPESYLGKVKPGMLAYIKTDSYPDKHYQAWVGSISPTAEFTPKNIQTPELRTRLVYQMRVFVCNPHYELRLGMPATVSIDLSAKPGKVPTASRCAASSLPLAK